jgi:hypothetical protein
VLHGERSRRGDGGGLLEREPCRLRLQHRFGDGGVLREGATVAPQVCEQALAEDLVTGAEPRDVDADRLDDTGQIGARDAMLRSAHARAHEPQDEGDPSHRVPDIRMDRSRVNLDQNTVIVDGGSIDLAELENVGRAVAILHDRLHGGGLPCMHPGGLHCKAGQHSGAHVRPGPGPAEE